MCAYFIHNSYTLNHRVNRLTETIDSFGRQQPPDSLTIFKQQFKEDSYIKQLDNSMTLILWLIPILLTIFGLISFNLFNERVKTAVDSFVAFKEEQRTEHAKHVEAYHGLQHSMVVEFTEINAFVANMLFVMARDDFKRGDHTAGIYDLILTLRCVSKWYDGTRNKHPKELPIVLSSLRSGVNQLLEQIKGPITEHAALALKDRAFIDLIKLFIADIDDLETQTACVRILRIIELNEPKANV
jgi:hypothetical protein